MKKHILILTMALGAPAWARYETPNRELDQTSAMANPFAISQAVLNGVHEFSQNIEIKPEIFITNGKSQDNRDGLSLNFEKGEGAVVRTFADGVLLTLQLDEEERGTVPEQMLLSYAEFERSGLRFVELGGEAELNAHYSTYESITEASHGRRLSARRYYKGALSGRHRMHYMGNTGCVAYVTWKIGWPGGAPGNGRDVTTTLKRRMGYHHLDNCSNPPVGAVASWSGGSGAGHTAYWTGSCWAYDLACADPGPRYHFLECVARN